jgi:heme exporter protein D
MDGLFTEYLIWKAIGLGVLVFVVSFVYRVKTGRSLTEDRTRAQQARQAHGQERD